MWELNDYERIGIIGKGNFGTVYLAVHRSTKIIVAIKVVKKKNADKPVQDQFRKEAQLLKSFSHPFIIGYFDFIEDTEKLYLIIEYAANGNLQNVLFRYGLMSSQQLKKLASQLVIALTYCHRQKFIAHRDLKPENILLDSNLNLRLSDFGLCCYFESTGNLMETACGTPAYAAPELILRCKYTNKVDIWSFGITLYLMAIGRLPFVSENVNRLYSQILKEPVSFPDHVDSSLQDLIIKMLAKDPADRITLEQIREHPWYDRSFEDQLNDPRIQNYLSDNQTVSARIIGRTHLTSILSGTIKVKSLSGFSQLSSDLTKGASPKRKSVLTRTAKNRSQTLQMRFAHGAARTLIK